MRPRARTTLVALVALVALVLASCRSHPWYLVESTYQAHGAAATGPEIVRTETYRRVLGQISTIAVSAPSRCAPLSPTEGSESAVDDLGDDPLRGSECGVELAEFERALVRTGYRVISWDAVNQMVVHGYLTPLEAARGLGADVLFQLNRIERSTSHDDAWQRVVYVSDERGMKGAATTVPPERAVAIAARMRHSESALLPMGPAGVALNLTAVLTRNGEAIWFYEGIHHAPVSDTKPVTQLLICNREALSRCYLRSLPGQPRPPRVAAAPPSLTHEQSEKAYATLLHGALETVVAEFRSGGR